MDMETVLPRTCTICMGTGVATWYIDEETFEIKECDCQYKEETNG
jgi:hypothetical protein